MSARFLIFPSRTTASGGISFRRSFPSFCVCGLGAGEDDCAFCPRLDPWLKLQESPLTHCPAIVPLNADFFPFTLLTNTPVSILFIPGFEVGRPNHLIFVSSHHTLALLDLDPFLGRT